MPRSKPNLVDCACDIYLAFKNGEVSGKDDWEERRDTDRARRLIRIKSKYGKYGRVKDTPKYPRNGLLLDRFVNINPINPDTGQRIILINDHQSKEYHIHVVAKTKQLITKELKIKRYYCQWCDLVSNVTRFKIPVLERGLCPGVIGPLAYRAWSHRSGWIMLQDEPFYSEGHWFGIRVGGRECEPITLKKEHNMKKMPYSVLLQQLKSEDKLEGILLGG